MERNQSALLAIAGAGLLAAIAIGVVLRGSSSSEAPEDAPAAEVAAADAKAKAKAKAKAPMQKEPPAARDVPSAPDPVPEGGYTETASGLAYHDTVVGTGDSPEAGSIVVVEYAGFLTDGTLFDSSYQRQDPFRFPLGKGRVIQGWDEGVATMKIGGKRQLKVPHELAYGAQGRPPTIPPAATLIFDVELKEVLPPRIAPTAPQELADDAFQTTDSGLKFHDFTVGTGAAPKKGEMVEVDYTGWLTDGTKFDSSLDRAMPIRFPVGMGRVIPGWDEGILSMKVGGKRQLVIPGKIAYGERGRPPKIPPDATLVFEVELVGIQ